jgi:hypothetical protein
MKQAPSEMVEGPDAFRRFDDLMDRVVKVPRATVQAKIEDHREQVSKNPKRRGPKPKKVAGR